MGSFTNDLFNGWGTLYIIGGEKYEGEWKNGTMHGQGKYFTHSGILIQVSGEMVKSMGKVLTHMHLGVNTLVVGWMIKNMEGLIN